MVGKIGAASPLLNEISTKPTDTPAKIKDAAEQFEGLLIGQLLKTSREAGSSGWMGTGDDQAGQIGMEMAEQSLARSMSSHGGLGLSALIAKGLQKNS
jgi:Rod binding domain-containing protein